MRDASAVPVNPITTSRDNASPELKRKLFSEPDFMRHTPHCQCFYCRNIHYQWLTFSASHARAHLYSLTNYPREAELHFVGACDIKFRLDERDSDESRQAAAGAYRWKRRHGHTVDYMLYLLDFSMYMVDFQPEAKDEALVLIDEAMEVAAENDLSKHPVCVFANELFFQHHMYEMFEDKLCECLGVFFLFEDRVVDARLKSKLALDRARGYRMKSNGFGLPSE